MASGSLLWDLPLPPEIWYSYPMARIEPKQSTKFRLLALSGNKCAFPECDQPLVNEDGHFVGQFCHIEAAEKGGERYNPDQTDEERRSIDNLILLCANHHIVTNDTEKYDIAFLKQMKRNHERQFIDKPYVPSEVTLAEIGAVVDESVRRATIRSGVTPYSDAEFAQDMAQIQTDTKDQLHNFQFRFGHSGSAMQQAGMALQKEATKKRIIFQRKKAASDRMYELRRQDIIDDHAERVEAVNRGLRERGMGFSGLGIPETESLDRKRDRELEKLKLEFGKE
jgi:hypothetical protein